MGEMDTQNRDKDVINAELFGNDIKIQLNYDALNLSGFKVNLENMIRNAKTHEDLNAIGARLNYAIDNKLDINTLDYQFMAAKKMTEIYNIIGEPVKGKRIKIRRSELD